MSNDGKLITGEGSWTYDGGEITINTEGNEIAYFQDADGTEFRMSDPDALEHVKLIVGKVRNLGDGLYMTDNQEERHMKLDDFLLSLLEKDYPEMVEYVRKVRRWYG